MNPMYAVKTKKRKQKNYKLLNLPNGLQRNYLEAKQCYESDLYYSCCLMCRVVLEQVLKKTEKKIVAKNLSFYDRSLMELINGYGRIFNQEVRDAMFTIYWNGNQSAHSDTITGKKEANDSFRSLQIFLTGIFSSESYKNIWYGLDDFLSNDYATQL